MTAAYGENLGNHSDHIGYFALRLAISQTMREEEELKSEYVRQGLRVMVTEVGGNTKRDFQEKISRSVLGAALNGGIIKKESREIHALFHAAEEAKRGGLINTASEANLALKVSIVRSAGWIAVGIFGESAIHPMTSHERCGLGIMNF